MYHSSKFLWISFLSELFSHFDYSLCFRHLMTEKQDNGSPKNVRRTNDNVYHHILGQHSVFIFESIWPWFDTIFFKFRVNCHIPFINIRLTVQFFCKKQNKFSIFLVVYNWYVWIFDIRGLEFINVWGIWWYYYI